MISFDIESLFTNIPLEECIDLAVNYISKDNADLKLSKTELRSLFTVATAQTHFLFNSMTKLTAWPWRLLLLPY